METSMNQNWYEYGFIIDVILLIFKTTVWLALCFIRNMFYQYLTLPVLEPLGLNLQNIMFWTYFLQGNL